jgi:hypothetical protein
MDERPDVARDCVYGDLDRCWPYKYKRRDGCIYEKLRVAHANMTALQAEMEKDVRLKAVLRDWMNETQYTPAISCIWHFYTRVNFLIKIYIKESD